jgi:ribonuclease P/MRP protein subunit RPP20
MAENKSEKSPKEVTKRSRLESEEYILRKRLPNHLPKRDNDIYVNMKTNFSIQLKKCEHIIDCGQYEELFIHGLGKAVNRAINMALQLQSNNGLEISCNTSSVDMIDDFEPIGINRDLLQSMTQKRTISAIHIKLFRKQQTKTTNK